MRDKHFLLLEWNDPFTRAPMEGYMPLPIVIGRGRGASLRINDEAISREHIMIALTDSGLVLRDLSSTNGTLLNGRVVDFGHLSAGDCIAVGQVTFRVSRIGQESILKTGVIMYRKFMEDRTTALVRHH